VIVVGTTPQPFGWAVPLTVTANQGRLVTIGYGIRTWQRMAVGSQRRVVHAVVGEHRGDRVRVPGDRTGVQ
jgi:hypothetical protein